MQFLTNQDVSLDDLVSSEVSHWSIVYNENSAEIATICRVDVLT